VETRRRRRLTHEINVVPYIDVMLVLVVIFMATATIALGVQVDLPSADARPIDTHEEPLQLTVQGNGKLYLNVGKPNQPLSEAEVVQYASAVLQRNPKKAVVVSGDRSVDYGTIMNAMSLLQQAGAQTVGLQSRARERR
jgi:biopolymer transport protein TolR